MKHHSSSRLLFALASFMKDYKPVLCSNMKFVFEPFGGKGLQGQHRQGFMEIFACECAYEAQEAGQDPMNLDVLGRRVLRAMAHEFRHSQQDILWETTDIPTTDQWLKMGFGPGWRPVTFIDYRNDKGEQDAKRFSQLVVNNADERFVRLIGRYSRWCVRYQMHEYLKRREEVCED